MIFSNKFMKNKAIIFFLLFLITTNCAKTDPATGEKVLIEPNPDKRARDFADKGGGILGDLVREKTGTNFEFTTSNVLWRATLKTLDFLPLANSDYRGGVIIYDWYSNNPKSKEELKVSIRFLNNELRSDSIEVISFKKICDENKNCLTSKADEKFSNEIKDTILLNARKMKIEDTKKKIQ
jgi:hypothetical protein